MSWAGHLQQRKQLFKVKIRDANTDQWVPSFTRHRCRNMWVMGFPGRRQAELLALWAGLEAFGAGLEAVEAVTALGWWSQGSCRRWDAVTTFWGGDLFVCALKLSHFGRRVTGVKGKRASREWKDWRDGRHLWKVFPLQTCYTCFLYFTALPFWKKDDQPKGIIFSCKAGKHQQRRAGDVWHKIGNEPAKKPSKFPIKRTYWQREHKSCY